MHPATSPRSVLKYQGAAWRTARDRRDEIQPHLRPRHRQRARRFQGHGRGGGGVFESSFTDPVTINVRVERGLSGGLLGHSDYALTGPYTFAQITSALAQETHSGSDVIALAHLPTVDPISGTHAYYMTSAQAKALGPQGA